MIHSFRKATLLVAMLAAAPASLPASAADLTNPQVVAISPVGSATQNLRAANIRARLEADRLSRGGSPARPQAAAAAPKILSGAVLSTDLTVGNALSVPKLQFSFATGSAGLSGAAFTFTSPAGGQSITVSFEQGPYQTSGNVIFEYPYSIPAFSQPGIWQMTGAIIVDFAGNASTYTAPQLAGLFSPASVNVINTGPVDIEPPKPLFGKVLTPTVSLSSPAHQFKVSIAAKDNFSGVATALVLVQAPNATYLMAEQASQPAIVSAGTLTAVVGLYPFNPIGTWTIGGFILCDLAGNCFSDESSVDVEKMFGTVRFKVTN